MTAATVSRVAEHPAVTILVGGLAFAGIAVIGHRMVLYVFHRGWEQGHAAGLEEGRATYTEAEADQ